MGVGGMEEGVGMSEGGREIQFSQPCCKSLFYHTLTPSKDSARALRSGRRGRRSRRMMSRKSESSDLHLHFEVFFVCYTEKA